MLVDGPRDQFLAGAALAGDQHDHVLVGDPADGLVDLAHGRAAADDRVADVVVGDGFSATTAGTRIKPAQLEGLADDARELLQVDRLEQVIVGPLLDRLRWPFRPSSWP